MMRNILKYITIIFLSIGSLNSFAQNYPDKPNRIVNDYANFLSTQEQNALENKLVQFSNQTSSQIAIAIVPTLDGYDAASYAFGLGDKWGIGQKGKNNGILILVKPKQANSKGEVYIATGYGMEGAVPDAITKNIINHEILPNFEKGLYYKGLDEATNRIMELTRGEYTAEQYKQATSGSGAPFPIAIVFLIIIVIAIWSKFRRAKHYAIGHNVPFWIALGMLSSANRSHGGSFGGFSSGSGSFGGFSGGGGFGGFGGGSFGGGGAGGSW